MTPLVIELCRIYGDMSQSSGTPWYDVYHRPNMVQVEIVIVKLTVGRSGHAPLPGMNRL